MAVRQAHSALQDGQRVCRSFGMRIPLEREGKRSEDWFSVSDAVKARFQSFKTLGMYRRPLRPCNLMLRRVREVADRRRHRAILDRPPREADRRALARRRSSPGWSGRDAHAEQRCSRFCGKFRVIARNLEQRSVLSADLDVV